MQLLYCIHYLIFTLKEAEGTTIKRILLLIMEGKH